MVTIEDVAEKAGVSIATVSRVINNEIMVTQDKINKVKNAINDLGYVPNTLRRKSQKKETKIVMVVTSDIIDDMLSGISDAAKKHNYDIMLNYITNDKKSTSSITKYLENGIIDGVILINYYNNIDEIIKINENYPLVQCGDSINIPDSCMVSINDEKASYEITNHLFDIGKRRIAFTFVNENALFANERKKGYVRSLFEHHVEFDPALIFQSDHSFEGGVEAANHILSFKKPVDAIMCSFDVSAVGCITQLKKMNVKVPEQIAVTGFDNTEISEIVDPKITTIAQPFYQIGYESMRILYSIINGELSDGRRIYLNHELIVRKSSKL